MSSKKARRRKEYLEREEKRRERHLIRLWTVGTLKQWPLFWVLI